MRIRIVAFATASEALGSRRAELELPAGSRVGDLLARLAEETPAFAPLRPRVAVAVDGRLASEAQELVEGSEVALLPPVSGGRDTLPTRLTREPIEIGRVLQEVADPACGAQVVFLGTVRRTRDDRAVTHLSYEAYQPMADEALNRICRELSTPPFRLAILHRLGEVEVGEASVVIACSSPHRQAAYECSRRALERLKSEVPIWKREHYDDGSAEWREEEPLGVFDG